jgi:hypothetical protein
MRRDTKYKFAVTQGRLKEFLAQVVKANIPPELDAQQLRTWGFKGGNDRRLLTVLRMLGLVDGSKPTQRYRAFHDPTKRRAALQEGIRDAYADLYANYADAHRRPDDKLRAFFKGQTHESDKDVGLMTDTFKTLCEEAGLRGPAPSAPAPAEPQEPPSSVGGELTPPCEDGAGERRRPGAQIAINIQLEIPATDDASVYNALFKALREHLGDKL